MEKQEEAVMTFLTQEQAAEIDDLLTGSLGFTIDQLMELAGLSVASAVSEVYKPSENNRVLVICGPGNNGGDGLVAARHLHHFGYKPCVCYPKRTPKPLFSGLVTQGISEPRYLKTYVIGKTYNVGISNSHSYEDLESLSVPFIPIECVPHELLNFDIIVDAIFGFSFHGNPRPPFDDLIRSMASLGEDYREHHKSPFIVSVDIPSGWHVENGDISGEGIIPHMLVSLTAPKLCAKTFGGPYHFIGGRFVPPSVVQKYKLKLPPYPGTSPCVRIGKVPQDDTKASASHKFLEKNVEADPFVQFQIWFDDAVAAGLKEPNVMALSTATKDGKPSSRIVQLKEVGKGGFVWCSNYGSRKGLEISENPHAAILFYWNALNRQAVLVTVRLLEMSEVDKFKTTLRCMFIICR
ncbi:Pyridoxine/pyridoxamine 5'-phosphate oxidase 1, chloroplastic [Orobanche gracilis]